MSGSNEFRAEQPQLIVPYVTEDTAAASAFMTSTRDC